MDFDLNLLRVLSVIAETGSVSRAAEKLGMSQPGLSSALARLRERLQDPLFVRTHGRAYVKPARGQAPTNWHRPLAACVSHVVPLV